MNRYAEDANYWDTYIEPSQSRGEIWELLEGLGADSVMIVSGKAGGKYAWLVRFQWQDKNYHFVFSPLECRFPFSTSSFKTSSAKNSKRKKRQHDLQARYQMGRIAVNFVKAILTAAEAQPGSLFGFLELPSEVAHPGDLPPVASEIELPKITTAGLLPEGTRFIEGEFTEQP